MQRTPTLFLIMFVVTLITNLQFFKEHILKFFQGDKIDKEHMLLRKLLNKTFKVKISDGRTLVGSFLCTDKDQNVILGQCQEYVKPNGK